MTNIKKGDLHGVSFHSKFHLARLNTTLSILENTVGRKLLDDSCGKGFFTNKYKNLNFDVFGIDSNILAIKFAKDRFIGHYMVTGCLYLPFKDSSFDVIVMNNIIEHIDDSTHLLAESNRLLTSDGVAVISAHNKRRLSNAVYWLFKREIKSGSLHHTGEFSIKQMKRMLKNANFEDIGIKSIQTQFKLNPVIFAMWIIGLVM